IFGNNVAIKEYPGRNRTIGRLIAILIIVSFKS
ncbi:unnamed protein product, partial [marine sediment metagenome]